MEFIFKVRCLVRKYKEIEYLSEHTVAYIDNFNQKISLIGKSGYFKQYCFSPLENKDYNNYSGHYRFNRFDINDLEKYKTVMALVDVGDKIKAGVCYEAKPFYYLNKIDERKIEIYIDGVYHTTTSSSFRILLKNEALTYSRKSKIKDIFREEIYDKEDDFFRIPK